MIKKRLLKLNIQRFYKIKPEAGRVAVGGAVVEVVDMKEAVVSTGCIVDWLGGCKSKSSAVDSNNNYSKLNII